MQADMEDFKTGWYGISLGLKSKEIDELIAALQDLKKEKSHFHFRSEFEGAGGVGNIEIYFQFDEKAPNLVLESSCAEYTK